MHFNNQVLKVGTFDGILFSFFFDSIFFCCSSFLLRAQCFMQATTTHCFSGLQMGVVAQVVTNWGAAAAIKFYN